MWSSVARSQVLVVIVVDSKVYSVYYEQDSVTDERILSLLCKCFRLFYVKAQPVRGKHLGLLRYQFSQPWCVDRLLDWSLWWQQFMKTKVSPEQRTGSLDWSGFYAKRGSTSLRWDQLGCAGLCFGVQVGVRGWGPPNLKTILHTEDHFSQKLSPIFCLSEIYSGENFYMCLNIGLAAARLSATPAATALQGYCSITDSFSSQTLKTNYKLRKYFYRIW